MMEARIKLLTLWFGPLPSWIDRFRERMAANSLIDWELIQPSGVDEVNALAADLTCLPCRKATPYSLCDLRPLFGWLYGEKYAGYGWWGWCDLDIVAGDLDRLLPPLLDANDVVSAEPFGIAGCMTLLRNSEETCSLWRTLPRADLADVLTNPGYCNFDETGRSPVGDEQNDSVCFTNLVNGSGLRVRYDDRSWSDSWHMIDGELPSRTCRIGGKRTIEVPTEADSKERELLLYHFSKGKAWPA